MEMQIVAEFISHRETVFGVGIVLVAWAFVSGISFYRGTNRLIGALGNAKSLVEKAGSPTDFAQNYEVISPKIAADPVLGSRWREYAGSLVLPQESNRPIRATTRAGYWFDTGLLRVPAIGVDARYHAALPNLLVGAGLLFTFLGLAAALGTAGGIIGGEDQAGRNTALKVLLDTASFKFITSLIGLLLSILYALFRKSCLKRIERAIDGFLTVLETRVVLLTPAALQQEANDLLKRQSIQLETFSTDLAVNLGSVFDSAFDERLGEHIAPLTDAMQRLAEGMGSRNEDALKSMLDTFVQKLQGGTGDRMEEVTGSLAGLSTRLESLQSGLGDAAMRMAQAADAMANRMGEGAEAALSRITDQIGGLAEGLRNIVDQTNAAGTNAGRDMSERIEAAAKMFEQAAQSVSESLTTAAAGMEARMGDQATQSSARLSTQFEAVVNELRLVAENSRTAGTEAFSSLAERIGIATAAFESTASRVAGELGNAATNTSKAWEQEAEQSALRFAGASESLAGRVSEINAATNAMVSKMTDLQRATQEAVTPLAATANEMKLAGQAARNAVEPLNQVAQIIGRSLDQIAGVAQRLDATHAAAARLIDALSAASQRFEGLDQDLSRTLVALQNGLQGFTREVQAFVTGTDENLAKAATQLGSLVKGLQDTLEDFDPIGNK
ncbi:anti-phage ZorAB system protein ZorA [Bradyrhizobium sp. AUGA SZCCT0042]|uniref:anti-phage ZorAB system protein ZorA n=1 Tax=Bradyrhizobium sp. AUGA SZCCT0042 TaxID=2807651 RepID=UPI001BA62E33|nr:anti-phage ZorAB system protein ZorA [Bradyrhizobium sp. AUGA SZCCT0042]MBR1296620.1 anti-phage defense protein ZorA [Bradyrhizobium sp. AUGA SZCCT0042]